MVGAQQTKQYLRAGTVILDRQDDSRVLFAQKFDDQTHNVNWALINGYAVDDDQTFIIETFPNDVKKPPFETFVIDDVDFPEQFVISA